MTSRLDADEAIGSVERIVNRGGDADGVLRAVLEALHERGVSYAAVRFVENGVLVAGPSVGSPADATSVPVLYEGNRVGELSVAVGNAAFAERLATLIAPYVLVGWDTAGEPWSP
jgi:hypothetical protein